MVPKQSSDLFGHTCTSKQIEGKVEYVIEPMDRPDQGGVLIGCSQPNRSRDLRHDNDLASGAILFHATVRRDDVVQAEGWA